MFGATDVFSQELADLATDIVQEIAGEYDWQKLTKFTAIDGDGSSIAFDLPSDFGRMPLEGEIHSKDWQTVNYSPVRDKDEWIYIQDTAISGMPGRWIMLGGRLQFYPPMPIGEKARFYYISKNVVAGDKAAFTADNDTFILNERLLTLGLMWRWRQQKRMEYAEDMTSYQLALEKEIAFDRGRRIIAVGKTRVRSNVTIPYPGAIVP